MKYETSKNGKSALQVPPTINGISWQKWYVKKLQTAKQFPLKKFPDPSHEI
jgi:hypothetical protein